MKSIILHIIFLVACLSLDAQMLTIDETVNYVNNLLQKDFDSQENFFGGKKSIRIATEESKFVVRYIWEENEDAMFPGFTDQGINFNELVFDIQDIKEIDKQDYRDKKTIIIKCDSGNKDCVKVNTEAILWHYATEFCDRPEANNFYDFVHLFYFDDDEIQSRVFNALIYIMYEMVRELTEDEYEDPFSDRSLSFGTTRKEVVQLNGGGGVSELMVSFAGIDARVILDSGASDVSIPKALESMLIRNELIEEKDYLEDGLYTIADGSVVRSRRFIISEIELEGIKVKNVRCSVNQSDDVILLGMAFLDRFKSWKIDNELNQLILEY